mgnify:CR=1 FL=1
MNEINEIKKYLRKHVAYPYDIEEETLFIYENKEGQECCLTFSFLMKLNSFHPVHYIHKRNTIWEIHFRKFNP